ncbi:hypothetical protein MBM_09652 [Drepanopeziza brunnea f. sp. 'multigermtubi' MB_m1]|uniref:Uncharacterized protein n=1 Tax=Marssonina brunnea f. sp. multigermtubi (strain MB_m1) TaxID=1072389 RepID=K1WUA9_MARBU|nr:uncharacterized protein MBM_09652 [Drepanopeziza brunnea f. sp. 'multigermtubi' MB_m1]EKD12153.1 hypothetical protein MBM_09652 [Drepanopeziza brunnea f. sp. 'multigermtubi' MB_m1]
MCVCFSWPSSRRESVLLIPTGAFDWLSTTYRGASDRSAGPRTGAAREGRKIRALLLVFRTDAAWRTFRDRRARRPRATVVVRHLEHLRDAEPRSQRAESSKVRVGSRCTTTTTTYRTTTGATAQLVPYYVSTLVPTSGTSTTILQRQAGRQAGKPLHICTSAHTTATGYRTLLLTGMPPPELCLELVPATTTTTYSRLLPTAATWHGTAWQTASCISRVVYRSCIPVGRPPPWHPYRVLVGTVHDPLLSFPFLSSPGYESHQLPTPRSAHRYQPTNQPTNQPTSSFGDQ